MKKKENSLQIRTDPKHTEQISEDDSQEEKVIKVDPSFIISPSLRKASKLKVTIGAAPEDEPFDQNYQIKSPSFRQSGQNSATHRRITLNNQDLDTELGTQMLTQVNSQKSLKTGGQNTAKRIMDRELSKKKKQITPAPQLDTLEDVMPKMQVTDYTEKPNQYPSKHEINYETESVTEDIEVQNINQIKEIHKQLKLLKKQQKYTNSLQQIAMDLVRTNSEMQFREATEEESRNSVILQIKTMEQNYGENVFPLLEQEKILNKGFKSKKKLIYQPVPVKGSNLITKKDSKWEFQKFEEFDFQQVKDKAPMLKAIKNQMQNIKIEGVQDRNNHNMYKIQLKSQRDSLGLIQQLSNQNFKIEVDQYNRLASKSYLHEREEIIKRFKTLETSPGRQKTVTVETKNSPKSPFQSTLPGFGNQSPKVDTQKELISDLSIQQLTKKLIEQIKLNEQIKQKSILAGADINTIDESEPSKELVPADPLLIHQDSNVHIEIFPSSSPKASSKPSTPHLKIFNLFNHHNSIYNIHEILNDNLKIEAKNRRQETHEKIKKINEFRQQRQQKEREFKRLNIERIRQAKNKANNQEKGIMMLDRGLSQMSTQMPVVYVKQPQKKRSKSPQKMQIQENTAIQTEENEIAGEESIEFKLPDVQEETKNIEEDPTNSKPRSPSRPSPLPDKPFRMRVETQNLLKVQQVGGVTITDGSSKKHISPKVQILENSDQIMFDLYNDDEKLNQDPGTAFTKDNLSPQTEYRIKDNNTQTHNKNPTSQSNQTQNPIFSTMQMQVTLREDDCIRSSNSLGTPKKKVKFENESFMLSSIGQKASVKNKRRQTQNEDLEEISPSTFLKSSPQYRNISPRYNSELTSPKTRNEKNLIKTSQRQRTNPNAGLPVGVNLTRALNQNYKMDTSEYQYLTIDKVRIRRASLPEILTNAIGPATKQNLTQAVFKKPIAEQPPKVRFVTKPKPTLKNEIPSVKGVTLATPKQDYQVKPPVTIKEPLPLDPSKQRLHMLQFLKQKDFSKRSKSVLSSTNPGRTPHFDPSMSSMTIFSGGNNSSNMTPLQKHFLAHFRSRPIAPDGLKLPQIRLK